MEERKPHLLGDVTGPNRPGAETRPDPPGGYRPGEPPTAGRGWFSRDELLAVRAKLGPIVHLDLTAHDIVHAHYLLGLDVAAQVDNFVGRRVFPLGAERWTEEVRIARATEAEVRSRLRSKRLPGPIHHGLGTYLRCLIAWSEGADLRRLLRRAFTELQVDGRPVEALDLAFAMQNESAGCQTGLWRAADGSVTLWHTEEDRETPLGSRFDRLRLASFQASSDSPSRVMTAFVYPDLLPGPAFGWAGAGYVQAVDAFYLQPPPGWVGVPANAITWICLFLGGRFSTAEIAGALAPTLSGYALSSIVRAEGSPRADTTEFVAGITTSSPLPETPGSFNHKVNQLSHHAALSAPGFEGLEPRIRRVQEQRIARARRLLGALGQSEAVFDPFGRVLASRVGADCATANPSVKAHFLCHMSRERTSYRVGPGPALRQDADTSGGWSLDF